MKSARLKVEELKMSQQAAKSKGKLFDSLMVQKRNGKLPGIYGRLVSLSHFIKQARNKYKISL